MHKIGEWQIEQFKTTGLPQKVQSAFTDVTSEITGADYQPVLYLGHQLVNGVNHCILCVKRPVTPDADCSLVKFILNIDTTDKASLVSVSKFML